VSGEAAPRCKAEGDRLFGARTDLAAALAAYDAALRHGADAMVLAQRRWMCAMLLGDFAAAWRIGDAVLEERKRRGLACDGLPLHLQWVWDGTPLDGKSVLVRCHHGLGDVIQFIRFAAPLRARARRVVVEAVPAILPLIGGVAGVDEALPIGPRAAAPPHDVAIELMELPHALRVDLAAIPRRVPYLRADPARTAALRRAIGGGRAFTVGVAWAAGSWRPERSFPVRLLRRLAAVPGVVLVNMQRGPALAELSAAATDAPPLRDWGGRTTDLAETAAALRAVDHVVSVDTVVAHLAGALAVPVWTLLHFAADWRWMAGRQDSPWYPTMRLFRQPAPGAWRPVIAEVAAALAAAGSERRFAADVVGSRP
jgi:hypothetical protein